MKHHSTHRETQAAEQAESGLHYAYPRAAKPWTHQRRDFVESEWQAVETDDAAGIYITAMDALNLTLGPGGDWHQTRWRPPAGTGASTRTPHTESLCRLGTALWGRQGLIDARPALQIIGHPAAERTPPVWCACYARAVAEMVMDALPKPHHREIPYPDVHSARRWLDKDGREHCARLLVQARPTLTQSERKRLDAWVGALLEHRGLLYVDERA